MYYESTRGGSKPVTSAEAIKQGIAPDGGLFVPGMEIALSREEIGQFVNMSYRQRAKAILKLYIDDYTDEEIGECVDKAYTGDKFDTIEIAPVHKLTEHAYILELWHGPTCAFKDMALQILPHLLIKAVGKTGETNEIVILVATSGDTGKAALEGFRDVGGIKLIVFYPDGGVSRIQKMQMITQEGDNVCSVAVEGNFDDAQNGVKAIFNDAGLKEKLLHNGYKFSSANSINWGRLVPQIVYYFSAYADMIKTGSVNHGEKINIVVPTGNFGNILAAYYSLRMGLPVNKLICASNDNNILTDFIATGTYNKNRGFRKTISPSMDILISSNLERLLFEITGRDADIVNKWMDSLAADGIYAVNTGTAEKISGIFWAGFSSEAETLKTIECIYRDCGYLTDPHTAVGIDVYDKYVISTGDMTKTVIASTASPFKFNESVAKAIFNPDKIKGKNEFELLGMLSAECGLPVPQGLKDIDKREIRHNMICKTSEMKNLVESILCMR